MWLPAFLAVRTKVDSMPESTRQAPKFGPTQPQPKPMDPTKNPHAVALGRLGGLRGGMARAVALSPRKRSQIAAKAAKARRGTKTNNS